MRSKKAGQGGDEAHMLPFLSGPCWCLGLGSPPGAGHPLEVSYCLPQASDGLFLPMVSARPICWETQLFTPAFPDIVSKAPASRLSPLCGLRNLQSLREHYPGSQATEHQSNSAPSALRPQIQHFPDPGLPGLIGRL